jgi:glucose/mannose-6-phosphate isomerase
MRLDDLKYFQKTDPENMLKKIDGLPDQLQAAWELGHSLPLPDFSEIKQVVVAGMGGSAIGADLLASYVAPIASVPVTVWRGYDLPAYAQGSGTLVIASSHSGNTEETLSAYNTAVERKSQTLAITTGGRLKQLAEEAGSPCWQFDHGGPPRAAVGYSFGLLLALAVRAGWIPEQEELLSAALTTLRDQAETIAAESPVANNPAKRMAGQMVDRWPTIVAGGFLAPVARRWRTQIAELAKAVAQFEELPEADHNMVAGILKPEKLFGATMVVFLRADLDHPRLVQRVNATKHFLMVEGFNTDMIKAPGENRLAQQWSALHFGDYTAYYLAMAYGLDPTPIDAIEDFKEQLR